MYDVDVYGYFLAFVDIIVLCVYVYVCMCVCVCVCVLLMVSSCEQEKLAELVGKENLPEDFGGESVLFSPLLWRPFLDFVFRPTRRPTFPALPTCLLTHIQRSMYPPIYVSTHLRLSIHLSIDRCTVLSVCLLICLSDCAHSAYVYVCVRMREREQARSVPNIAVSVYRHVPQVYSGWEPLCTHSRQQRDLSRVSAICPERFVLALFFSQHRKNEGCVRDDHGTWLRLTCVLCGARACMRVRVCVCV